MARVGGSGMGEMETIVREWQLKMWRNIYIKEKKTHRISNVKKEFFKSNMLETLNKKQWQMYVYDLEVIWTKENIHLILVYTDLEG